MTDLITRLQAAEGPSRELDTEICEAIGFVLGQLGHAPPFTTSIDAALTLVPEGWHWAIYTEKGICGGKGARVNVGGPERTRRGWSKDLHEVYAATPALALCIAALRARGLT